MRGRELLRIVDAAVPNLTSEQDFTTVLKALALDGQWRRVLRLLREIREAGLEADLSTYNWVLSAMAKDKQVDRALVMLGEMREKGLNPDIESFNYCIGAAKPGEWQQALVILEDLLPAAGLEPDGQSFEGAAAACEEAREWQRSLLLFLEIGRRGLRSTSVGHNYALSACRQGKQWQLGYEIMRAMREQNFEPDFRLKADLEAQSRGLERAPPPEPSSRSSPSPDNVWQRKQQLRELREQERRRQEEKRVEEEQKERERQRQGQNEQRDLPRQPAQPSVCQDQVQEQQARAAVAEKRKLPAREGTIQPSPNPAAQLTPSPLQQGTVASSNNKESQQLLSRPLHTPLSTSEPNATSPRSGDVEVILGQRLPREPRRDPGKDQAPRPKHKLRAPGSYVLPVFAQHDRSNHAERQALIKVIARVQEASGAKTDEEFEAECAEVTGTVRVYASHTPCISCMACFCQFQRLFPKVKLCVDFDDWRDTRRMVEMARRDTEHKRRCTVAPTYHCPGLSDMSDEEAETETPESLPLLADSPLTQ